MYRQSTAPVPRRARSRAPIFLIGLALLLLGAGIGVAMNAIAPQETVVVSADLAVPAAPPTAIPTATAQPAPQPDAVGTTGHVKDGVVFVERLGLSAYERADKDRDSKGTSRVLGLFETLIIDGTVPVRVVDRVGTSAQVEFLDGAYRGRRGWLPVTWLLP